MQLAQEHRLRLHDRLAHYLPDLPSLAGITLRQLLTHTSGLHDYLPDAFTSGAVVHPTTPRAIAQSIAATKSDFAPGERYGYTNSNYVLLGLVVEAVASMPLERYVQTHIFAAAGMKASGFSVRHDAETAVGYVSRFGPPVKPYDASWLYADGNIVSTAADIARFDIALMNGTLVQSGTLMQMETDRVPLRRGARSYYGLHFRHMLSARAARSQEINISVGAAVAQPDGVDETPPRGGTCRHERRVGLLLGLRLKHEPTPGKT